MASVTTSTAAARTDSMSVAKASAYLFMSPRNFRLLLDQGVFTKAWGRGYDAQTILREYLEHLRKVADDRQSGKAEAVLDPIAERARRDKEQADRIALQNAVTRGEQAPIGLFQLALDDATTAIRARITSLPDALADQLVGMDRTAIKAVLKLTVDAVLLDLAQPSMKTD